MKYKIEITKHWLDPNEQDSYRADKSEELYTQTTDDEIDLKAIIDAFNKKKAS